MKTAALAISALALIGTIVPPLLFVADRIALANTKAWMLLATLAWFASAPVWMRDS